jgi:protease IV
MGEQQGPQPGGPPPQAPPQGYIPPMYGQPRPAPRRTRWGLIIGIMAVLLVLGGGFVGLIWYGAMAAFEGSKPNLDLGLGGGKIALIRIDGVIEDAGSASLFGSTTGMRSVMESLRSAARDSSVKAIVLRINSPGGSAAASQEVYEEVRRVVDKKEKPVIVSMGDVAASGGYYIASAADYIIASPATTTGSIGVISEYIQYGRLADKYGVQSEVIKSGKFKDMGNPLRAMTPEERVVFQALVMDVYDQFVKDVCAGRSMKEDVVRQLADGRVYTGAQAKKLGLIDDLGNLYDAIHYAGGQAKLGDEPELKEYGRRGMGFPFMMEQGAMQAPALQAFLEREAVARRMLLTPIARPRAQM